MGHTADTEGKTGYVPSVRCVTLKLFSPLSKCVSVMVAYPYKHSIKTYIQCRYGYMPTYLDDILCVTHCDIHVCVQLTYKFLELQVALICDIQLSRRAQMGHTLCVSHCNICVQLIIYYISFLELQVALIHDIQLSRRPNICYMRTVPVRA
jgi:hypothetical protein